jgi:hypothetical protein
MSKFAEKPLNAIQAARVPQAVQDASLKESREALIEATGKGVITFNDSETGATFKTWRDARSGKWIQTATFPDGSTSRLEADSRDALLMAVAAAHAQEVSEEYERSQVSEPTVFDEWIANYRWGKECERLMQLLPDNRASELSTLVKTMAQKLWGERAFAHPGNLETAFIRVLDSGALDGLMNEAAAIERQAKEATQTPAVQRTAKTPSIVQQRAQDAEQRRKEDAENRALAKKRNGMKELRRRALFSGHVETTPYTGTR